MNRGPQRQRRARVIPDSADVDTIDDEDEGIVNTRKRSSSNDDDSWSTVERKQKPQVRDATRRKILEDR
jgi:hypothetical protein